jgi:cysteine desulfurase/selenocysteine lyase
MSLHLRGTYAVDRSLDLLLALGTQSIEKHVLNLAATFHEELLAAGVTPAVPGSGSAQSHILTIGTPDEGGHGFSTNPMIEHMSSHLQNRSITHTIRRGQLRFSMHGYNNEKGISEAVDAIKDGEKEILSQHKYFFLTRIC